MKEYHVTIKRQNSSGEKWNQSYVAEFEDDEVVSVMNVLDYIYQNLDGTLAYFSHAACKQAACGKCGLRMDGKVRLACKEHALDNMVLEPMNENVVRDLICRN